MHRLYWLEQYFRNLSKRELGLDRYLDGTEASNYINNWFKAKIEIYHGDARNLEKITDESIDLIATQPPYYNIIRYSEEPVPGDLSAVKNLENYLEMLYDVAKESYRVLKPGRYMGILVGDAHIHKHYTTITYRTLRILLKTGFILKEEVIKVQHKMKVTREK